MAWTPPRIGSTLTRFLNQCGIPGPPAAQCSPPQPLAAAHEVGYPVLVRPSRAARPGLRLPTTTATSPSSCASSTRGGAGAPPSWWTSTFPLGREVEVGDWRSTGRSCSSRHHGAHRAGRRPLWRTPSRSTLSTSRDKHKQTILEVHLMTLSKALGVVGLVSIQFVILTTRCMSSRSIPASLPCTIPYISKGHWRPSSAPLPG